MNTYQDTTPQPVHWLESLDALSGRRRSFDVTRLESVQESEYGGTFCRTTSGDEFHITMEYEIFNEARHELTGINVMMEMKPHDPPQDTL